MKYIIIAFIIGYLLPMYIKYKAWRTKLLKVFPSNQLIKDLMAFHKKQMNLIQLNQIHSGAGTVASVWYGPGRKQFEVSIADPVDILQVYKTCDSRAISIEEKEFVNRLGLDNSLYYLNDANAKDLQIKLVRIVGSAKLLKKSHYLTFDKVKILTKNWAQGNINLVRELDMLVPSILGELLFGPNLWDDKILRLLKSIINDSEKVSKVEKGLIPNVLNNNMKLKAKKVLIPEYQEMLNKCDTLQKFLSEIVEKVSQEAAQSNTYVDPEFVLRGMVDLEINLLETEKEKGQQANESQPTRLKNGNLLIDVQSNIIGALLDSVLPVQSALYWFFFNMAAHKDIQEKLLQELDSKIGRTMSPTYDEIENLKYLDACVLESMRLNCPIPVVKRVDYEKEIEIGGKSIPKGTPVNMSVFLSLKDASFFGEDANVFNPDRFVEREGGPSVIDTTKVKNYVSTFGFGSRRCIGKDMSVSVIKACLVSIFQKFEVSFAQDAHQSSVYRYEPSNIDLVAGIAFPSKDRASTFTFTNRKDLVNI